MQLSTLFVVVYYYMLLLSYIVKNDDTKVLTFPENANNKNIFSVLIYFFVCAEVLLPKNAKTRHLLKVVVYNKSEREKNIR